MHLKSVCWRENRVLVKSWNTELDNLMEIIIIKGINNFCEENSEYNLCALQTTESYKSDTITGLNISPQQLHIQVPSCLTMSQPQEPDSGVRLSPAGLSLGPGSKQHWWYPRGWENGRVSVSLHQFPFCHLYLDNRHFFNSKPATTIGIWPYSCNSPKSLLATHSLTLSHLSSVQCFSARVLYDPLFIFLKPTHNFKKIPFIKFPQMVPFEHTAVFSVSQILQRKLRHGSIELLVLTRPYS